MQFDIPIDLIEKIRDGDCVLFVGAGLSMGAGLPGWKELVSPLCEKIGAPSETDLLTITQVYEDQERRNELVAYIQMKTDTTGIEPTKTHEILTDLGIRIWITTNFDNLIEKMLDKKGYRVSKVVTDRDLPLTKGSQKVLIKFHGDREQPDTINITKRDFWTYFRRFPGIKDEIAHYLRTKTFLFLGYSVNDPDFNQIHSEIMYDLKDFSRNAYAVLVDANSITIQDLKARNIKVINLVSDGEKYSDCLYEFLLKLKRNVILRSPTLRKEYDEPQDMWRVPDFTKDELAKKGLRPAKCIEYFKHWHNFDDYIWSPIVWRPPEADDESFTPYERTDDNGNIWDGFVNGDPVKEDGIENGDDDDLSQGQD